MKLIKYILNYFKQPIIEPIVFEDKDYTEMFNNYVENSLTFKYDSSKRSILLIDDNPGIISFLIDDLKELAEEGHINLSDYNILTFYEKMAAFDFVKRNDEYNGFNIDMAIIDITYGGRLINNKKVEIFTGVDVFDSLYKHNPKVKYIFYSGNPLNPYIKSNKILINQFHKITGEDIMYKVLVKTSLCLNDRRKAIKELFFYS
jgi:hypothetical protein